MAAVRVLVVDDDAMVREYLTSVLPATGQVEVAATARDGAAALEQALRERPDVVLMDLRMPGVDGITATRELAALADPPAVLVLTTFDTDDNLLAALDAGARGFLLKTTPPAQLVSVVLAAATGASVLSPESLQRLRDRAAPTTPADPAWAGLPPRDREILVLLAEGLTNNEIARRLYVSPGTIKGHLSRLMADLDRTNRTQLAAWVLSQT